MAKRQVISEHAPAVKFYLSNGQTTETLVGDAQDILTKTYLELHKRRLQFVAACKLNERTGKVTCDRKAVERLLEGIGDFADTNLIVHRLIAELRRRIPQANKELHLEIWARYFGLNGHKAQSVGMISQRLSQRLKHKITPGAITQIIKRLKRAGVKAPRDKRKSPP